MDNSFLMISLPFKNFNLTGIKTNQYYAAALFLLDFLGTIVIAFIEKLGGREQ